MTGIDTGKNRLPFIVVTLRILLTPAFFYAFMRAFTEIAVILFLAAFASDIIDGLLAKRQETTSSSPWESFLDPVADFLLVFTAFYAFSLKQFYPSWILVVLSLVFLFFIFTSNKRGPLYDPVGKHYGTFLMMTIGLTLVYPAELILNGILFSILIYTVSLVLYRAVFIWENRKENEDSMLMEELKTEKV